MALKSRNCFKRSHQWGFGWDQRIQNAYGGIVIATSGAVIGLAGPGIAAEESLTGVGNILVDGTGDVTGTANGSDVHAEDLNSYERREVVVSQTGNVTGGFDGIYAIADGSAMSP